MKRKLFLILSLALAGTILISGGLSFLVFRPQLETPEFWNVELPEALWIFPGLIILALILAWWLSGRLTEPIRQVNPEQPGEAVPYEELLPLMARIREQDRAIHRQREELGQARRDFDAVTANMTEGFVVLDRRLNVAYRNISARYLLPLPEDGGPDNLQRSACPPEVVRAAEKALVGNRTELTLPLHGRFYQLVVTPVFSDSQITGAVVIAMDVTEREERESLRREFSANVSHELKTPLTSISGFAELLKDGMAAPDRVGEFGGEIYQQAQRMIALVDDIIELSRLEDDSLPIRTEPVKLRSLAEEVLADLAAPAEKQGVTLHLEGEETEINGIRAALREMLFNLCDNAVKYNRPGGSVKVSLSEDAAGVCLCVEDTGIGIPFEHQSRVFERFYRVDKSHSRALGGTGLGLSIVKHAAQLHRARLELHSTPGVGTRITIRFPAEEE